MTTGGEEFLDMLIFDEKCGGEGVRQITTCNEKGRFRHSLGHCLNLS